MQTITHYLIEPGRVVLYADEVRLGTWEPTIGDFERLTRATAEASDLLAAADELRAELVAADRAVEAVDHRAFFAAAGELIDEALTGTEAVDEPERATVETQLAEAQARIAALDAKQRELRQTTEPIAAEWWCRIIKRATGHKISPQGRPVWMTWGTLVLVVEGLRALPLAPGARVNPT